ncbi:nuclear transport factor 2 family protein [Actinomadura sp. WMMB 499]|uniref:nuclear transport factor 2 family protein n=1 Tax=Actinomadura sp. WMMB 499 TaxID=1219491 RepID=UPI0012481EEC|nr:nuclear transport factor 2 family protein [Actinomadura sp. WMMB 499]QFG24927.1 nuclear transport factor 2 family protein [Actinomadura sp. WMMB 499]
MSAVTWNAPDADHPARRASRASMAAVLAGDKDAWLKLFAPDVLLEDPVGPSFMDPSGEGHRGHEGIGAFWDGFVATVAEFRFHIRDSFANGDSCANVTTITTTMGDGATLTIDCVLIYRVDDAGLVTSMRAHWEPDRALATRKKP